MATSTHETSHRGRGQTLADCCSEEHCDSGRRNRYFPHKRITSDTYQVEQDYQVQRRRLLNRAIHGWGVVYGYALALAEGNPCSDDGERQLMIEPGLALDPCGRELVQVDRLQLDLAQVLAFDAKGCVIRQPEPGCRPKDAPSPWDAGNEKSCWLLRVHYAERLIAPVALKDPCQCEDQQWDQVCETVRYSLTLIDCEECCRKPCCELECCCTHSPCCPEHSETPSDRGGCRCLCDHLTRLDPTPDCCPLSSVSKGLRVDLYNGVPLACMRLARDECGEWTFGSVADDCGPRRLVKRNDLLFDLIRGCDLTRIARIGWAPWHRLQDAVDWDKFAESFGPDPGDEVDLRTTRDYIVEFSRPVRAPTVSRDCFAITIIGLEAEGGWGLTQRVPIREVLTDADQRTDGLVTWARLVIDNQWARDALSGGYTIFHRGRTRVEIEIRGDYILDCNGQALDANARGLSPGPTGNGTPGGSFFSTFEVGQRSKPATKLYTKA